MTRNGRSERAIGYPQCFHNAVVANPRVRNFRGNLSVTVHGTCRNNPVVPSVGTVLANHRKGLAAVFEALLKTLNEHARVTHRPEGVAFLRAAKGLYCLDEAAYACANIPIPRGECRYSHCLYTSAVMSQWV